MSLSICCLQPGVHDPPSVRMMDLMRTGPPRFNQRSSPLTDSSVSHMPPTTRCMFRPVVSLLSGTLRAACDTSHSLVWDEVAFNSEKRNRSSSCSSLRPASTLLPVPRSTLLPPCSYPHFLLLPTFSLCITPCSPTTFEAPGSLLLLHTSSLLVSCPLFSTPCSLLVVLHPLFFTPSSLLLVQCFLFFTLCF